jgi:pectinesterase
MPVNAVVAQDGSGDHANVSAAVAAIPSWFQGRYVIYVKAGLYNEVLNISKHLQNVTLLGDGADLTVISADRNVASGLFNTYRTSTVGN